MDPVTQGGVVTSSDYGGWVVDTGDQSSSEVAGQGSAVTAGTLVALAGAPEAAAEAVKVAVDGKEAILRVYEGGRVTIEMAGKAVTAEAAKQTLGASGFFNVVAQGAAALGKKAGGAVLGLLIEGATAPPVANGSRTSPQFIEAARAYYEEVARQNPDLEVRTTTFQGPDKPFHQLVGKKGGPQDGKVFAQAGGDGIAPEILLPVPLSPVTVYRMPQPGPSLPIGLGPVPNSATGSPVLINGTGFDGEPLTGDQPSFSMPLDVDWSNPFGTTPKPGQTGQTGSPPVRIGDTLSGNPLTGEADPAPVTEPPVPGFTPTTASRARDELLKAQGELMNLAEKFRIDPAAFDPQAEGRKLTPQSAETLRVALGRYDEARAAWNEARPDGSGPEPEDLFARAARAALKGFDAAKGAQTGGVYDPFLPGAAEEFKKLYPRVPLEEWVRETSRPGMGGEAELERRLRDWAGDDPAKQMAVEGLLAKRKQPVGPTNGTPSGGAGGTTGNGGANAAGGAGDEPSKNDLDVLRQAIKDTVEAAAANPVTPSGYNESTLIDSLLSEAAAGRETAVLLGDSNNFSTYNQLLGNEGGDAAIEATTQAYNRAAARLNEMYADQGIRFFAGRKAGDEMFMVAVIDPSHPNAPKQMPKTVPQDMVRVTNDEIQATNAARIIPIPTGTSSAAIIPPARAGSAAGLKATLDEVDHAGTAYFNQGGGPWQKNGGGLYDLDTKTFTPLPGPTYQPREGQQLPNFAAAQGRIKRPGEGPEPNATIVTPDGTLARPEMIPDPSSDPGDQQRVPLPDSIVDALIQKAVGEGGGIMGQLNALRESAPLEAVFRKLAAEGIDIKNQPVGLAILDGMIEVARARNGEVTLEAFEPRGLKKLNDEGRVLMPDGSLPPSSHGGGDQLIEHMVRANQKAIDEVLADRASDVVTFRDRGKRFMNAYPSNVTPAEIERIQERRAELFKASPLEHTGADGIKHPIVLVNPDGTTRPFVLGLGYAAVTSNPATRTEETAQTMRDWLVAPLPGPNPAGKSALELGNDAADRLDGSQVPFDLIPNAVPGLRIWTTPLDPFPGLNQRRQPPAP
jgi:hypothetical protein